MLPTRSGGGWTAGRVMTLVLGSVLALISLGLLGGGGTLMWADQALRHDGYVTTGTTTYSSTGYALASERVDLGWGWLLTGLIGDVRLRVTATDSGRSVFVAIGPADQVSAYLSGAEYTTVTSTGTSGLVSHHGIVKPVPPRTTGIWTAQVAGSDTQALRWTAHSGDWMAVAMNPDGSAGLAVRADAGVSAPWLFRLAVELIIGGIMAGALSAALIWVPVRLAAGTR
ncbi:MAG TPA: hypothetical protein VF070_05395 [Streptosporangiaceae bacterium]